MTSRARALFGLFVATVTLVSSSRLAYAQMSEGERKAAARAAYGEGIKLQDQGKPADALSKFEAAQKLYDAPTHQLHIAECQALLGKLVEAAETYEALNRRTLPPGSPDVFVQAQAQAKTEAPQLRDRIPDLKITVKPEAGTLQGLVIVINDRQMPNELVGITRPVNPGVYRLSATANGWSTRAPVEVELREKETKSVELVLQQGGGGAVVVPVPPPYGAGGGAAQGDPGAAPAGAPPDADASKPAPPKQPPSTGLLVGGHGGVFFPGGNVGEVPFTASDPLASGDDVPMGRFAGTGSGIGADLMFRFSRTFLVGGRAEAFFLGAPDSKHFPNGATVKTTTNMFGGAAIIGLLTSSERVGFYSDVGFGYRQLNSSQTISGVAQPKASFNGTYFTFGGGLSIPAGPTRIVPKISLDVGSLEAVRTFTSPTGAVRSLDSGTYTVFGLSIGLFYNVDFTKKPQTTTAGLGPQAAPTR
jgi:hypothetical protein